MSEGSLTVKRTAQQSAYTEGEADEELDELEDMHSDPAIKRRKKYVIWSNEMVAALIREFVAASQRKDCLLSKGALLRIY
jgi:hypothetical protein